VPSPMRAFAQVAARFGCVHPEDEREVDRFFEEEAPTLPQDKQAKILEALLELEGTELAPLTAGRPANDPSDIHLEDPPSVVIPEAPAGREQLLRMGETAGAMALAFGSLLGTVGLDIKVRIVLEDRSVRLLLGGPDAGRLYAEDKALLATMESLAEALAERNEAIEHVTMSQSVQQPAKTSSS
jgi:hypothetical protein